MVLVYGVIIKDMMLETVDRISFQNIFLPNGLPRLVILENRRPIKGEITGVCKLLCITCMEGFLETFLSV